MMGICKRRRARTQSSAVLETKLGALKQSPAALVLALSLVGLSGGCHITGLSPSVCERDDNCPFDGRCVEGRCVVGPAGPAFDAGSERDAGAADAGGPDAGNANDDDAGVQDAGFADAGQADDAGAHLDAGDEDAGDQDGGAEDAGRPDGGPLDAGRRDGGPLLDAGFDGGDLPDGGPFDAGVVDAGVAPPIAHWQLDGDTSDLMGAHDAVSEGSVRFGKGIDGHAAYFNTDGVIRADGFFEFQSAAKGSIAGWFRDDHPPSFKVLAGFGYTNFPDFSAGTFGSLFFLDVSNTNDTYALTQAYETIAPPGRWHHFAVTFDGTQPEGQRGRVFLDGVARPVDVDGPLPTTFANLAGLPFEVSRDGAHPWRGFVDDIQLYDRALHPDEILAMSQAFVEVGPIDFAFFVPFDGSFRNIDALNGGVTEVVGNPTYTGDAVNVRAVTFSDGDALHYDPPTLTATSEALSVSLWLRLEGPNDRSRDLLSILGATDGLVLKIDENNRIFASLEGYTAGVFAVSAPVVGTPQFSNDEWHHLVFVYDDNQAFGERGRIFVDGLALALTADNLGTVAGLDAPNTLRIGSPTTTLDGAVDEVRAYPRALSSAEVLQLYSLGTP